jgi:chaperonin GroES
MLKPLRNYVLVERPEDVKQTSSGIILAAPVEEKLVTSTIVAVGPGRYEGSTFVSPAVRVGDTVLFPRSAVTEVKDGDKAFYLLEEERVLCVKQ